MQKKQWQRGALGLLLAMVLAMASGLVPATALADGPEEGVVDVELASDVEDIPVVQAQGEVELRPQMGLGDKRGLQWRWQR